MRLLKTVFLGAALALAAAAPGTAQTPAAPAKKVLRYAFEVAETSLDPAKVNDLYSRTLTPHIFEGLYKYDHLARPIKIKPLTADGMPQASSDFRVWTVRIKPGGKKLIASWKIPDRLRTCSFTMIKCCCG